MNAPESTTLAVSVADIERAAARQKGRILDTPFLASETLSEMTGCSVFLKFENLQFTGSFKERGALNRLLDLMPQERERGVVAASAGNHAQGLAYHASRLGIPTTIVMPENTPSVKVQRTRAFGAEVVLTGREFQDAAAHARELVDSRGLTLVHPYDDAAVIAGQGTIALELIRSGIELDALVVPIGGGGLLSGIAVAMRHHRPEVELIGVQSEWYPAVAKALGRGDVSAQRGTSIAEGIAVAQPGHLTLQILKSTIDDVILVPESRIEEGMALLLQVEKTLSEGAGAAGLAALLHDKPRFAGRRVGLIICGGNVDNRVLISVLQRQLVREGRLLRLTVALSDQAGSLARLCSAIGECGGNINSVSHDRTFLPNGPKSAQVDLEVEVPDATAGAQLVTQLHLREFGPVIVRNRLPD